MPSEAGAEDGTTMKGWQLFSSETLSGLAVALGGAAVIAGVHAWSDMNSMKDAMAELRQDNRTLMALLPTSAVLQQQVIDLKERWSETRQDVAHLADALADSNRIRDRENNDLRRQMPAPDKRGDVAVPERPPG